MANLKLNGVNKVYPSGSLALHNISLEAKDKEFLVISGGENSGKSTLLRVIAGLEEVTSGEIFIGDKDATEAAPKDRDITMVFKSDTLYPNMTVFENMAYGLRVRKAPQTLVGQRVKAAAAILGLESLLYRKPKMLTAAQKQRVAIARSIVREPKLYLFDEPLSGLDDKLKAELLNIVINMQARMQGTFIYSTKNVAEAMTIGTRIVVLKNGIVQQIDTPANLYDYPVNAYVAFYIGAPTINFINDAEIQKTEEGLFVVGGGLKIPLTEKISQRFENLADYAGTGKRVIAGIRPEDARCGAEGFDAACTEVKKDGENAFAECDASGNVFVAVCDAKTEKGAKVKIKVDADRLYLFDADTRLTLLSRDGGYEKTEFAEADYVPPTFAEEEAIIKRAKPEKNTKKKK